MPNISYTKTLPESYFYKLAGKVVHGFKRGRKLGFPTANIDLDKAESLKYGSYISLVKIKSENYPGYYMASLNLGKSPTFEAAKVTAEPHILGFNADIYGKIIEIYIYDYIRPMYKFDNENDLKKALKNDTKKVREYFQPFDK